MILYGSHYGAGSRMSSRQGFSRDPVFFLQYQYAYIAKVNGAAVVLKADVSGF